MSNHDWTYCDGHGHLDHSAPAAPNPEQKPSFHLTRRRQILSSLALGAAGLAGTRSALTQIAVTPDQENQHTLVVIFLRGGADGLNIAAPYVEDHYYRARPSLGLPKPNGSARESGRLIDLDGHFGLNPALLPLMPEWDSGDWALIHACGSEDTTRSHFEAMRTMEYGAADGREAISGGWLGRYLTATSSSSVPLRAAAFGTALPDSLRGSSEAIALGSLDDFQLFAPKGITMQQWASKLGDMYDHGADELTMAGHQTLRLLDIIRSVQEESKKAGTKSKYPDSDLGRGLHDTSVLIKAEVGLEAACLDRGAWDTHVVQGAIGGWLTGNLEDLASCIRAFLDDLGDHRKKTTVIVQTEFGRRVEENINLGTDHGRAGVMMVFGVGAGSGKVMGEWPGIDPKNLDEVGDLRAVTDYRDVLSEVVTAKMRPCDLAQVFPHHSSKKIGLFA